MSEYKNIAHRLDQYMQIEAISRYEDPVVEALKSNIKSDNLQFSRDKMGSLIIHKKSKVENAPKVMIAAHMDEVGYLVRMIKKNGNILVSVVGGVWPTVVIGTKAKLVTNKENKEFIGVFGHTSIHILEREKVTKAVETKDLYVDFGFSSDEEVKAAGIEIGDRIYLSGETIYLPNDLMGGKAMDNRAGVTAIDFIANNVKDLDLPVDLYIVGTVQEEVGTRGAKTSVSIINPDIAFAVDTGAAHDTTGCIPGTPVCGKGAAVLVKDNGTLMDPLLVEKVMEIARKNNIPAYKYIAEGGGTDAAELQYAQGGAATITISIPQRYLHSPIGVASLKDIKATIDLMTEFVKSFTKEDYEQMKYKA